jgi:hypothetical protein
MVKKDIIFYILIMVLVALLLWQWISKGALINQLNQLNELEKDNKDLNLLSGLGPLKSAHLHADVKVYINGQAIDFSQKNTSLHQDLFILKKALEMLYIRTLSDLQ